MTRRFLRRFLTGVTRVDLSLEQAKLQTELRKNQELQSRLNRLRSELSFQPPYTRDAGGVAACVEFEVDPEVVLDNPDFALNYVENLTRNAALELQQRGQ